MSKAPHATPLIADQNDAGTLYLAYQVAGGAFVLETFVYDPVFETWESAGVTTVFDADQVAALTSDVIYQPGDLEPSIGQDASGNIWYAATGGGGTLFFARIDSLRAVEDWTAVSSRPSPGRTLRYPGFCRAGDTLFFRASVVVDGAGTAPGDVGYGLWYWTAAGWAAIGAAQDDSTCLVWYDAGLGGNSGYQYAVLALAPGTAPSTLGAAWVKQANADLDATQGSELHFAMSTDAGLTWTSADETELGQSGVSGLPIVSADAGTAASGAGTLIATDAANTINRSVTVSFFADGAPMVAGARKDGSKVLYIFEDGAWQTIDLGARGVTPNRAVAYGADTVAVPAENGWWVSADRANGFLAWTFSAEQAETMGAGLNQYLDLDFLRRKGWARWIGRKLVADGGGTNQTVIGESNLFGAENYLSVTEAGPRRGFAGGSRRSRVQ